MGCANRICVAAILIWTAATPFCAARAEGVAIQYSAEELIAKIIASERRIHDVELHFDNILVGRGNHIHRSYDWGYQGGKKYVAGKYFALAVPERNIPAWERETRRAFDGQRFYLFQERVNFRDGQAIKDGWGGNTGLDRGSLCLSPTSLLGYELSKDCRTFGELLRDTRQVSLAPRQSVIDGHRCSIVEAIGITYSKHRKFEYDVRAWIDTKRDFRPLKIEMYRSIGGKNRWKVVVARWNDIRLEKIDGIWLPVDGMVTGYFTKATAPPRRMTVAQFRRLSLKRQNEVAIFMQVPSESGSTRMKVSEGTVRINKGIDPNKFTIAILLCTLIRPAAPSCGDWPTSQFRLIRKR